MFNNENFNRDILTIVVYSITLFSIMTGSILVPTYNFGYIIL